MKISIYKDGVSTVVEFPKPVLELQDILDRQHNQQDNACVNFLFPHDQDTLLPSAMLDEFFCMDIYRLNFLAAQYEQMSPGQHAAFVAVAEHLQAEHLYDLGMTILSAKKGSMTEYGVLVHDCDLYSMLPKPEWMQEKSQSEDETEDCELKWGDIS